MITLTTMSDLVNEMKFYKQEYIDKVVAENKALRDREAKLVEALEFYADWRNWRNGRLWRVVDSEITPEGLVDTHEFDNGANARAALKALETAKRGGEG